MVFQVIYVYAYMYIYKNDSTLRSNMIQDERGTSPIQVKENSRALRIYIQKCKLRVPTLIILFHYFTHCMIVNVNFMLILYFIFNV